MGAPVTCDKAHPRRKGRLTAPIAFLLLALMLGMSVPIGVQAEDLPLLAREGRDLGMLRADTALPDMTYTVGSPPGKVIASHVLARAHSTNLIRQRTESGFWIPWDGRAASLIDTGIRPEGGAMTFKVVSEPLDEVMLPLTVTLIARTADGLWSATLWVVP